MKENTSVSTVTELGLNTSAANTFRKNRTNTNSRGMRSNNINKKTNKTIIIFGSKKVGKTSLLVQLTKNKFESEYISTIAANFYSKEINNIELAIWDTNYDEINENILPLNIYKTASLFIIVCSYDNANSLNEAKLYINFIKGQLDKAKVVSNIKTPVIGLINKSDIKEKAFQIKDAFNVLKEFYPSILIGDISCKESRLVNNFFLKLIDLLTDSISAVSFIPNGANNSIDFKKGNNLFFSSQFKIAQKETNNKSNNTKKNSSRNSSKCC